VGPKFYGPFQVIEHVGDVAYKLKLWPNASSEGERCYVGIPLSEAPEEAEHRQGRGGTIKVRRFEMINQNWFSSLVNKLVSWSRCGLLEFVSRPLCI
jgi:hypothetical protein